MGEIETITVALPSELADALRAAVAAGGYATTSEIVREALDDWRRERAAHAAKLDALRAEIALGEEGPFVDAEKAFDHVLAELRAGRLT